MKTYSIVAERIRPNHLIVDCRRPAQLHRYSTVKWLERSVKFGEFRLRPASEYKDLIGDIARTDDELVRTQKSDGQHVTVTVGTTGQQVRPIGAVIYRSEIRTNYLVACFSNSVDYHLFSEFPDADACLIIHKTDEFCERVHAVAEVQLPGLVGIDGMVTYGTPSALGVVFSKSPRFATQREFRFAWLPPNSAVVLDAKLLTIGNIEDIAELRLKGQLPGNAGDEISHSILS